MNNEDMYDEAYFLRGKESGKSLYENYSWKPDLTIPMARRIMEHCGIEPGMVVLDFGCARGYLVRALRELGVEAFGYDTSQWAVDNADPEARRFLNTDTQGVPYWSNIDFDWVIAKDVLEHVEYVDYTIQTLMRHCTRGMLAVVPLSRFSGGPYVVEDYEKDVTHVQRLPLLTWANFFVHHEWRVECAYRLPGVKDNYYKVGWWYGNGFLTAQRIVGEQ